MDERESQTHAKEVLWSFEEMKDDGRYCDFTLKIGEEEIPVHRNVLAACSKYFDAMFRHKMQETETGLAEILGIEPSAGKQCLEYIYTGKVKFTRENPKDLIHAAELMQLHGLINLYFEYLVENIRPDNCLEYMELAVTYNQPSFAKTFGKFLSRNFKEVIKTDGFPCMNQSLLTKCLELLSGKSQYFEKLKCEAVKAWVNADLENRKEVFPELFRLINLEIIPAEFLREDIANDDLVRGSDECQLQVYEAWKMNGSAWHNQFSDEDPPTHILAYNDQNRLLHKYDLRMKKWIRVTRIGRGIVSSDTEIFSHRGEIYLASASGLKKFTNGSWITVLATRLKDCFCRVISRGDVIYLVTGSSHIQFNTKTNVREAYTLPTNLGKGFSVAISDKFLYVLGGDCNGNIAMEFDFSSKTWESIGSMNLWRNRGAALIYDGKLVAVGGVGLRALNKTVEYYETSSNKWIALPSEGGKNFYEGRDLKILPYGKKLNIARNCNSGRIDVGELKLEFSKPEDCIKDFSFNKFSYVHLE